MTAFGFRRLWSSATKHMWYTRRVLKQPVLYVKMGILYYCLFLNFPWWNPLPIIMSPINHHESHHMPYHHKCLRVPIWVHSSSVYNGCEKTLITCFFVVVSILQSQRHWHLAFLCDWHVFCTTNTYFLYIAHTPSLKTLILLQADYISPTLNLQ